MDFFELIKTRQSCRHYDGQPVSDELLIKCVEAAALAPSACNSQPWRYIVFNDLSRTEEFAKFTQEDGFNGFADKVPAFVLVTEEPAMLFSGRTGEKQQNQKYAQMDIGMSVMQFCLAAEELSLGTCILGSFNREKVADFLGLDPDVSIKLIIAVGYPANDKLRRKVRKKINETVAFIPK